MTETRNALMTGRRSDGRAVRRPLSPHLQIYKPQITSGLSIFHRISGVALGAGTVLLVWWLVAASTSDQAYDVISRFLRSPLGLLMEFGWTVALWFHFCAGIRHLFWDAGLGYELPRVHATGRMVLVGTVLLTLVTWAAGLMAW